METTRFSSINQWIDSKIAIFDELHPNRLESLILLCYSFFLLIIMYFHEPWFDEVQAWMIARSASVMEVITVIPHFEGHPPLWHLLLMPLAKSGVPFEIGLKSISFLTAFISMSILVKCAPFPRIIRCTLPFSYFLFYQFGVISRPYSLMTLGFILAATQYKHRNQRPFLFVSCLLLICFSSAYGIVLCSGICAVWATETYFLSSGVRITMAQKKRTAIALAMMFITNLTLVLSLIPYNHTAALSLNPTNTFVERFLYMFFISPLEATVFSFFSSYGFLMHQDFHTLRIIPAIILASLLVPLFTLYALSRKNLLLFMIPHMMLSLFSSRIYFCTHHIGVVSLFLLFWFWVTFDKQTDAIYPFSSKLHKIISPADKYAFILFQRVCVLLVIMLPIYWTLTASFNEIKLNYGYGREASRYIKENRLDSLITIGSWESSNMKSVKSSAPKTFLNTNHVNGTDILPYFSHNLLSNLNNGHSKYPYLRHICASPTDNFRNYAWMRNLGYPEMIIGNTPDLKSVFGPEITMQDYVLVHDFQWAYIWKNSAFISYQPLYVKRNRAEEHGLKDIRILGTAAQ